MKSETRKVQKAQWFQKHKEERLAYCRARRHDPVTGDVIRAYYRKYRKWQYWCKKWLPLPRVDEIPTLRWP